MSSSSIQRRATREQSSRWVLLATTLLLLVGGCVSTPHFQPTTAEGVQCKQDCAHNMQLCAGSSYTCDRSYAKCIEACVDAERVRKASGRGG